MECRVVTLSTRSKNVMYHSTNTQRKTYCSRLQSGREKNKKKRKGGREEGRKGKQYVYGTESKVKSHRGLAKLE